MENSKNEETQKAYWAKDIADLLDISTSNLRRWSIDLEKAGYHFYRDEHHRRAYLEKDIMPLKKLKELLSKNMSKNDAVNAVVAMFPPDKNDVNTIPVIKDKVSFSKRELQEIIHYEVKKAVEEEREAMFQAFERKMNDTIEMRDRQVTLSMQHMLEEQQKEIAATTENTKRKRWWEKLFTKEKEPPTKP